MTQTDNVAAFTRARVDGIRANVERVLQGKQDAIRLALVALLAGGHVLIEDVPGVGKTLLAKSLAESLGCQWRRVQFTPDLLPTDLIGVNMWDPDAHEFSFHPGPIFANVLLADEVNRASPKTQSALLECMEEAQVTVDGSTYPLAEPFLVIATQNPFEHEGTYPLPESQLDRFLVRIRMGYPARDAALRMLDVHTDHGDHHHRLGPVSNPQDVTTLADIADSCYVAAAIKDYVLDLGDATRRDPDVSLGVSPRGCVHLVRAAKSAATLAGRNYVVPDDVKWLAGPVLEHRLALTPEAQIRGVATSEILTRILDAVPVPQR